MWKEYKHIASKDFNQLYQIRHINKNISVSAGRFGIKMVYYLSSCSIWWISLLVILMQEPLWTIFGFVVLINHIYTYININTRVWVQNKMEQNQSDGSVFAIVFMRAKRAGAPVLKVLFWTHYMSFDTYLGLMTSRTKRYNN